MQPQKEHAVAEREKQDRRHALKRRMDDAHADAAIDKLVYHLYGLTDGEIETIEAADK